MKKISALGIVIVCIAILITAFATIWWQKNYPSENWKYKMTVTVETPEGLKTGSAVREIEITRGVSFSPHALSNIKFKGEAVVVDLGERGVLFALLTGDAAYLVPMKHFPDAAKWTPNTRSEPVSLPRKDWPRFVTFEDMNDPKTVKQVLPSPSTRLDDPYKNARVLISKAFGQGVSIKSVTIEMTDEDVTTGVVKYLPWLQYRLNKRTRGPIGGDPKKPFEDPRGLFLTTKDFIAR